jgi:hypothetical protein
MSGIPHRSYSGPPETFSPPFSPLYRRIRGIFSAIGFAVVFSPSLANSSDPGATLARASLNSSNFTAAERNSAARSRVPPPPRGGGRGAGVVRMEAGTCARGTGEWWGQ